MCFYFVVIKRNFASTFFKIKIISKQRLLLLILKNKNKDKYLKVEAFTYTTDKVSDAIFFI